MDVRVTEGALRGRRHDGIHLFAGIPYAAPPVVDLRFAAPEPAAPWRGVREATTFAEQAPQYDPVSRRIVGSEDCLYLNVYVPAEPGPHPVFVWIHGGGAVSGSPNHYDGTRFARNGVIVVTVGYRLGVLGLLHLPASFGSDVPRNLALADQIAALRWVWENISAFGGDPERITVGGESNGGRSAGTLLAVPAARGLFQQAVVQSGTGVGYLVDTPDGAATITKAVLAELGLTEATATRLRTLPVAEILAAQAKVLAASPILVPLQLVLDGDMLPRRPIEAVRDGAARDIRLLIGSTHDEREMFDIAPAAIGLSGSQSMVVSEERLATATAAYRRLLPDVGPRELRRAVLTASEWWIPAIRFAEAHHGGGGAAWMYRLDWRMSPSSNGMGAPHALDLPLVFGSVGDPGLRLLFGGLDPDRVAAITDEMHSAWVRFITTGDPGWPAYQPASRATRLFDDDSTVVNDPDQVYRRVWDNLI